jgi:hypothetical protein
MSERSRAVTIELAPTGVDRRTRSVIDSEALDRVLVRQADDEIVLGIHLRFHSGPLEVGLTPEGAEHLAQLLGSHAAAVRAASGGGDVS